LETRTPELEGVTIRLACAEDAEGLSALFNAGRTSTPLHLQRALPTGIINALMGERTFRLVAVACGTIIGQAGLNLSGLTGRLTMIVREDFRSRGIGTALLAQLISEARHTLAVKRIELDVAETNSAAIHLYHRCGFELEARRSSQYGVNILTMSKSIT